MQEQSIFIEALEKEDPAERAAFLDQACAADPSLRSRIERLLEHHLQTSDVLDSPSPWAMPTIDQPITEAPGTVIGPYKLMEQIGEGGMGVVYVAEQTTPVRRKVALKVIKPGMDTRQVVARFEAERQALAMMDHPNIAKIFDGGVTDSGRPYFVMELVRGLPITEYCDGERLSIRERLKLFELVCRAVQHAHQKGIIHRDLKPSNILVTLHDGVPVPKVIDFGVAKATGQSLTEKTVYTAFTQLVGTPLYMSPEQIELSGLDIDTRSDIYSLGVLLYELLTGTTPFDGESLRKAAFDEMRRMIREDEPPTPSTRLSTLGATLTTTSAKRSSDPRHLNRSVRGELDWIAMKALEKDRTRRYETANDLAADVTRYLTEMPVEACPPSTRYRVAKFARRNHAAITTVAIVSLALLAGTGVSTWLAIRATAAQVQAEDHLRLAREAVDTLYEDVASRWSEDSIYGGLPGWFLEKVLPFYQRFSEPRRVDSQVGRANKRVGEILIQLGRPAEAVQPIGRAEAIFRALLAVHPEDPGHSRDLADCCTARSSLPGDGEAHRRALEESMSLRTKLVDRFPSVTRYQSELATSHQNLGSALVGSPRPPIRKPDPSGEEHLNRALERRARLCTETPDDPVLQGEFGATLREIANLWMKDGRYVEAEPYIRRALAIHDGLTTRYPTRPQHWLDLAWDMSALSCALVNTWQNEEAIRVSGRAVTILESLINEDPKNSLTRGSLAGALRLKVKALVQSGALDEAKRILGQIETREDASGFSQCLSDVVWHLVQRDTPKVARPAYAVALARRAVTVLPDSAFAWNTMGMARYRAGQWDEAIVALKRANELEQNEGLAYNGFFLAMVYHHKRDLPHARAWYDRSVAWMAERPKLHPVIFRYRDEAADLLGVKPPQDAAKPKADPGPPE